MSHISVIKLPNNSTYDIKDSNAIPASQKGAANGVVPLNGSSKIDSTYLPSYVDDVIEGYYYNEKFWKESTHTTEITGEAGKIYINLGTSPATTYRYSGSTFVQIGSGGSIVTITRDLTSGVKSATISVNGTDFDIYSTEDTTYESKSPVSGGTALSLVTTGEKAAWNAKTSNTGTVTSITAGTGLTGGEITTSGTIALATSGATAGSYGDSAAQTPAYGGTFKVPYVTVDTYGRVTGISEHTVKIPASDNTWRGIQDNLTSSTNTTESLSAKQGYLLANGSARDNTKLPLTGGTVTGAVTFGSSVSMDEATIGDLVVNGAASCTNNLQVNTINGVAVGSSPKFTDNNTTYSAGTGISLSGTTFSVKTGYTTSGNNRAVQADSDGNLYVVQKDNNTTYSAGTGLSLSSTTFSVKLGYTTSGNNRAVQADSDGNLYVVQKDDNTNNAVTQTATTTSANYEVLFSVTADNTTRTEGTRKNSNLLFNPSTGNLQATQLNGVTIGSSPKFSDTVTTVSTTGSGNAVTAISASNGALTVTKGSTFLTSHQTVTNKGATLAWGSAVTVATIGSTNINVSLPANPNTNTHRPIQMNGTQILGDNTTALNLKAGSNISLSNSSGTVTIAATDTTYSAGSNITLSGTTFSLTKANVTGALGYTPPTTDSKDKTQTNTSIKTTAITVGAVAKGAIKTGEASFSASTGYTGRCVVGFNMSGTNTGYVHFSELYLNQTDQVIKYSIHNTGTAALSNDAKINVLVLCTKND